MGYYTYYSLNVLGDFDFETDYEEVVEHQVGYNPFSSSTKWYEFEKDMKKASIKHPKVIFELSGEGEESGDLWKAYFKNGKMQMCKANISYDEFLESKLV